MRSFALALVLCCLVARHASAQDPPADSHAVSDLHDDADTHRRWLVMGGLVALAAVIALALFRLPRPTPAPVPTLDVTRVSIGLDWRARRVVQGTLDALAHDGDPTTNRRRIEILQKAILTLLESKSAWVYGSVHNARPVPEDDAMARFTAAIDDARARYRRAMAATKDGRTLADGSADYEVRSSGADGLVVVTVVAASRTEIVDVQSARDVVELELLLRWLASQDREELVAMQVIWSPAADEDRMTSLELEASYPEMHRLDGVVSVGRFHCEACGGPYPRELGACPHCGAPTPSG